VKTSDVNTSEEDYYEIIGSKTAVLFAVACEIGAILSDKDEAVRRSLSDFGYNLGIAFQLTDDMLDYISVDDVLGKKVGTDLKEGKVTLPLIRAIKSATDKEKSMIQGILGKNSVTAKDFERTQKVIEKYNGIEYTASATKKYTDAAKNCLNMFGPSPYKEGLLAIPDYILKRKT